MRYESDAPFDSIPSRVEAGLTPREIVASQPPNFRTSCLAPLHSTSYSPPPYTTNVTPHTFAPTPYTPHFAPCTLRLMPFAQNPQP